ncbi:hypothetical protein HQN89_35680 [Paenibacillus frigoriresistens]|uniref:hypothetical protein n=1 Tax=Paenibacillus alginolyticus TaxID=59839 RepID=UPI0015644ECB|nr:hypothetical protein [Paenibacillus frigoriresistens]NRF96139.1 hypothetical protein [Paenibacillus frigoriresistens]
MEEDSFAAKTLDNLGLIPNLDRPVTVGEAAGIIQKIKAFVPSIGELEQKLGAINPDIRGSVDGVLSGFSDMNLTDKAKDAGGWIKDKTSGLFGKNPTDEEAKQAEESSKQKAADITKQIAEDAFRIFDHR